MKVLFLVLVGLFATAARARFCPGKPEIPSMDSVLPTSEAWGTDPVETNRRITDGYIKIAKAFEDIINPAHKGIGSWFNVAPYASREVGKGLVAFKETKKLLASSSWSSMSLAKALCKSCGPTTLKVLDTTISTFTLPSAVAVHAYRFLAQLLSTTVAGVAVFDSEVLYNTKTCDLLSLDLCLQTETLGATLKAVAALIDPSDITGSLDRIVNTGYKLLEHGNRLIFTHIGGSAMKYIEWRDTVSCSDVDPNTVLDTFKLLPLSTPWDVPGVPKSVYETNTGNARLLFDHAVRNPTLANTPQLGLLKQYPCNDIIVAAFALWEKGGDDNVKWGNNMMAYCEQAEAVAPAFLPRSSCTHSGRDAKCFQGSGDTTPPSVLASEVSRADFMKMLTPFVQLTLRGTSWSFNVFAAKKAYTRNWGRFDNRYKPILDAFRAAYSTPGSLWPPPANALATLAMEEELDNDLELDDIAQELEEIEANLLRN